MYRHMCICISHRHASSSSLAPRSSSSEPVSSSSLAAVVSLLSFGSPAFVASLYLWYFCCKRSLVYRWSGSCLNGNGG